jgi:hypothetical protein
MGKGSRRSRRAAGLHRPVDEGRARAGFAARESGADGEWMVRTASPARKTYVCPGCGRDIPPGMASVVAWQADGITGDEAAIEARRHWHPGCWRERTNRR